MSLIGSTGIALSMGTTTEKQLSGLPVASNRKSKPSLSQFLPPHGSDGITYNNGTATTNLSEAVEDRSQIIEVLRDVGIEIDTTSLQDTKAMSELLSLPRWKDVVQLYGPKSVILGLEQCQDFQQRVPLEQRFMGISGLFNTGTTAFGRFLQSNCYYPTHPTNVSNSVVEDVNGMLSQVPWAKHKHLRFKYSHTIHPDIPKDNVLSIGMVRDPYFWMQSMCRQGYGARWAHDSTKHCPNLVPNVYDRKRFRKALHNASSVPVWMGQSPKVGPSWDSLAHYWNDWYESYLDDFSDNRTTSRLLIRFEDSLFHPKAVLTQVCACGGGTLKDPILYLLDEAKPTHRHAQNNMLSAMIRYGTKRGRVQNMTAADLDFARIHFNTTLLELFQYQHPGT